MTDTVINVQGLGKRYRIRHNAERQRYLTLRDLLADGVKKTFGRFTAPLRNAAGAVAQSEGTPRVEDFWALHDVSFEVKQGEVVGIIGRNGAGKSTLLKILSRITEPSAGRVHLKGRVASLLEVGTGFHPELTGRENIFLNGAILGMSRQEIKRKFDQIVEFAEIERFLDTPVKRYSSGMYVRLAFAVAAHLEPEILIVDEVLAVGDAQFQKKCLGRMGEIGSEGKTVLFVSHNLGMISKLCKKGLLLDKGKLVKYDAINEVMNSYQAALHGGSSRFIAAPPSRPLLLSILEAETINADEVPISEFTHDEFVTLKVTCALDCPNASFLESVRLTVVLVDAMSRNVFLSQTSFPRELAGDRRISARMRIPSGLLTEGNYSFIISAGVLPTERLHRVDEVCPFYVRDAGSKLAHYKGSDIGCVFVDCDWTVERAAAFPETRAG